jgi:hypothetical protein
MDAGWFAVAVVGLLVAMAFGFKRWGKPRPGDGDAGPVTRFVLIATAVGGLLGAPFWWLDLTPSFAWDLPPVGARLLAAAALAFGAVGVMVLEHPSPARIRLYFILIALYLVPLGITAVAIHLDRFDFLQPVTYGFFAVVIVLSLGSLYEIASGRGAAPSGPPPTGVVRAWLGIAGLLLVFWGLALFATPAAPFPLVFNWPQDPLTARLIAAMLLTLGVSFLYSRDDLGLARFALLFGAVYGLGGLAACLWSLVAAKPVPPLYAWGLGGVGFACLILLATSASRVKSAA